jgi:tetraacyldisaccharide 4'-kinase
MGFQEILAKIFLFPLSLLYGIGVNFRNFLYQTKMIKSVRFDIPTIAIGNLSVGGAGKTPHVEYLIELLQPYLNVATLSRGYKRETQGFLAVEPSHSAKTVGDEPLQYKRKYQDVFVTVSESRAFAVPKIIQQNPDTQLVILDDAFQHRAVTPGLNILLTEFSKPYTQDYLLPFGRLREWRSGAVRAGIIIVTKCPNELSELDRSKLLASLKPLPRQKVFFSYYDYPRAPYYIFNGQQVLNWDNKLDVLLVCAIARTDYLVESLQEKVNSVRVMEFADHHFFSNADIGQVHQVFKNIDSKNKVIITTEKDAVRLQLHADYLFEHQLPIFALPAKVAFHFGEGKDFDEGIRDYLMDFRA